MKKPTLKILRVLPPYEANIRPEKSGKRFLTNFNFKDRKTF